MFIFVFKLNSSGDSVILELSTAIEPHLFSSVGWNEHTNDRLLQSSHRATQNYRANILSRRFVLGA